MMSEPWFKFYPSDWLAGTRGLSMAEAGLYITLIAMMYERGGPLDMERGRLARLCGASPAAFAKALSALIDEGKILETDDGLWSNRVQKELKKRQQRRDVASASAKKRWKKPQRNQASDDADAMQGHSIDDATRGQRPEARGGRAHAREEPPPSKALNDRFEEAWGAWPKGQGRNCGRPEAFRAFAAQVRAGADPGELASASAAYAATAEPEYCLRFDRFMRGETWREHVPPPTHEGRTLDDWRGELRLWRDHGGDDPQLWAQRVGGPAPGEAGCKAPPEILAEFGYAEGEQGGPFLTVVGGA